MNMPTKQANKVDMYLLKVTRNGKVTLPVELRKALQVKEGNYIAAETCDSGVFLKPISVIDQKEADRRLVEILSRVKYTGPEPVPSVGELTGEIADIIHDMRREHGEDGAR